MTTTPASVDEARAAGGEYRAGGTDLQARLDMGVTTGPAVDLRGLPGLDAVEWHADGRARIGALVPVAVLAADERLGAAYPGLVRAAAALATPQVRATGTIGGNLLQRNRCWYFRNPAADCLQKTGADCPARAGNHLLGVCFDLGPCVAPHASTLGMALLAYEAEAEVAGDAPRPVAALYDPRDGRRDHQLAAGDLLTHVLMPRPHSGERAAYVRATGRARAEWPLVEAVARLDVADETVIYARVAVGGVARVPLRLRRVEEELVGLAPGEDTLARVSMLAAEGANPLPMTGYKVRLLVGTVHEALERALEGDAARTG